MSRSLGARMIAWSTKVTPPSVDRYTWSAESGPSTCDFAVRCTSQIAPFQPMRSVFSLCWQIAARQSVLVTPTPGTRMPAWESQGGPGSVIVDEPQPASSSAHNSVRMGDPTAGHAPSRSVLATIDGDVVLLHQAVD